MKTLAERLKWARKEKGWTQKELALQSGVAQSTIGSFEAGSRSTPRNLLPIARALGVDPTWLNEGTGVPEPSSITGLNKSDFLPVSVFHEDNSNIVVIPLVRLRLRAGVTGYQVDDEAGSDTYPLDLRWVQQEGLQHEHLIAVKVKGESMEPGLHEGDIIVINTADKTPMDGVVFAVNYEGEPVVKRLSRDAGDWWLSSDNVDQRKYHRKICRGDACIIVGRVVLKKSKRI